MKPNAIAARNPVPGIKVSVRFISPTEAAELLTTNPEHQRGISKANLIKIESSLRDGEFVLNGQNVIVDEDGKLLDGQHRLQAAVNTGIGFWTTFCSGVPREYFKYMDCGKSRTFRDVLQTMRIKNVSKLSATIQRLAEYLRDPKLVGSGVTFAHSELLDVLESSPRLDLSVDAVSAYKHLITESQIAWLHYLANTSWPDKCESFFRALSYYGELPKSSPVRHFRNRIIHDREQGFHPTTRETLALLIKAWNAHFRGQNVTQLEWAVSEDFPILDLGEPK